MQFCDAYAAGPCALSDDSCKVILIYKILAKFQALAMAAYCVFRECWQLGFATLSSNLAVSGWVGLAYDC